MSIIEAIALILLIAWIGGFAFNVAGSLIHVLLVLAIVVFAMRFFRSSTL